MNDLNDVIHKLKGHLKNKDKISGAQFAQDVVDALEAICLRLASFEQDKAGRSTGTTQP